MTVLNRAILFSYAHYVPNEELKEHVKILREEAAKHEGRNGLVPVVMEIRNGGLESQSYFAPLSFQLPFDIFLLRPVWDKMTEVSDTEQPSSMTYEKQLDVSNKREPTPRPTIPRQEPIPYYDPALLPDHLTYVGTDEFRKEAYDFYKATTYVPMRNQLSDSKWIEKRFVIQLAESWPLVARLDEDLDGAISNVFRKLAATPNLPFWRSVCVAIERGSVPSVVKMSQMTMLYSGESKKLTDIDNSDRYAQIAAVNSHDACMLDDVE
ncbi:hypothetical protein [Pseudorhizobium flavum]|uniref:hypothetical protein n=1 Tax=Pseudorhizobium flavum TaxID=1335061 RepID=UPI00377028CE